MSLSIAQSQKKLLALQREGENKLCFECKAVNPQWASPKYGIFICLECAGTHRSLGVHISFVRSVTMDQFKPEEMKLMEIGGNEKARLFFEANGIVSSVSIKDKYNSTVAEDYREKLSAEAKGEEWTRRDRPVHIPHTDETIEAQDESTAAIKQFQKPGTAAQEPTLNDLAADALGAITSGWGWFSQTVTQSVSDTTENYIRPGMRQFAESDLGGNARKAMAQFGRRAKEAGVYGAEQLNYAIENFGLEEEEQPSSDSQFAQLLDGWEPREKGSATAADTASKDSAAPKEATSSGALAEEDAAAGRSAETNVTANDDKTKVASEADEANATSAASTVSVASESDAIKPTSSKKND